MPEELSELQENAEAGAHHASLAPVTITMAILAVLVAAVSLMGHRTHTNELLSQTRATDQWAYYEAKDIRLRNYQLFLDELGIFTVQSPAAAAAARDKYQKEADLYRDQQQGIEAQAHQYEADVELFGRRADRYDLGEVLLEMALVICSITLLTTKRIFWMFGCLLGIAGTIAAATGFLLR